MLMLLLFTLGAEPAANVAATVNGEVIRLDEVDAFIQRHSPIQAPMTGEQLRRLRLAVVDGMIDDLLLKQYVEQHAPKATAEEVDRHLQALTVGLRRQGKSVQDYLRETRQTEDEVRKKWTTLLRFEKYVDTLATDQVLSAYHEQHKQEFDGATVDASHIVLRVSPNGPAGERETARRQLTALKQEIVAGKLSFAEAAKRYSISPSANDGGRIGPITPRDSRVDEALSQAAFALEGSAISDPVETEFGVHLIQVTARDPGTPHPFDEVKQLVRDRYAEEIRQRIVSTARRTVVVQLAIPRE